MRHVWAEVPIVGSHLMLLDRVSPDWSIAHPREAPPDSGEFDEQLAGIRPFHPRAIQLVGLGRTAPPARRRHHGRRPRDAR